MFWILPGLWGSIENPFSGSIVAFWSVGADDLSTASFYSSQAVGLKMTAEAVVLIQPP